MVNKQSIRAYALKNAIEHSGKASQGPVINSLFNEGLKKDKIKDTMPQINSILEEVNKLSPKDQEEEFKKLESIIGYRKEREGLPELPNLKKGKVVTRFSPSPSGPLHFGHALVMLANYLYVNKFGGKFFLRIEDTNPDNIYKKAYKMIERDTKWLTNNNFQLIIQSDRLEIYYKYAEKLIKSSDAYICTCTIDSFKELITKSQACPCRKLNLKEHKERWSLMLEPGFKEGEAVLRFKSNIKDKNPAMRDFPLARIKESAHPRTGNKYRVWPLMNLAVTSDDIELGMTHIIRGKDQKDNSKRQEMIYNALNKSKKFPITKFIGFVHLKEIRLSSSSFVEDVTSGKYKSFDDPKLPTLSSLNKQGYKPETFSQFVEDRGLSESDKTISMKDLKEVLDNIQNKL